ncbi:MAG: hypothetical protein H7250_08915 [Flavobacterium sp.]|nr:hypothetical protein [Flavobacterium sp.]
MKRITFITLIVLFTFVKGNSQITNLNDLIQVSGLTVQGLIKNLQYTWEIKQPITDNSEKGMAKEIYTFAYNKKNEKDYSQVLKRSISLNLSSGYRIEETHLISNDMNFLNHLKKELLNRGFELMREEKNYFTYRNRNRDITLAIQIEVSDFVKLSKGFYDVGLIVH